MKELMTKMEKDALLTHLLFVFVCVIVILIPFNIGIGLKLFILVVIYNVIIGTVGIWRKYEVWINIWLYVLIISIFQVFPDWFLSAELNILVFPEDGFIKIGTVSLYMMGLWAIPLFLIMFIGTSFRERYSELRTYLVVALLSVFIFGLAEQSMWMLQSWYAQNVTMIGHLALYIIIPEAILGLSTYFGYKLIQDKNHLFKIPVAFIVMVLYLGSAAFFYFLIESVLLG
ncbi:MAG: DUF6989 domain-containing protein [Candidatus Hodarchaeales archaeon]|jgi:hypothetical protein